MKTLRFGLAAAALALAVFIVADAGAQNWPTKPVKIIAVFPAGGSVDQVARILAQQLTVQTGQSFIVDNRGGRSPTWSPRPRPSRAGSPTAPSVPAASAIW